MPIKDVQKTNKQHAVPQNIMDVEFKLIGDLTMRQFSYLMIFGLMAFFTVRSVTGFFKWPITAFFVCFGIAFAFARFQERGMDEWFINFIRGVYSPTQRIWRKDLVVPTAFAYQNIAVMRQELVTLAPTSSRRKLEEYLEIQQQTQEVDRLDIPEQSYIMKVRQAFAPVATSVGVLEEPVTPPQTLKPFEPSQPTPAPITSTQPPEPVKIEGVPKKEYQQSTVPTPEKDTPKEVRTQQTSPQVTPSKPVQAKKEFQKADYPPIQQKKTATHRPHIPSPTDSIMLSPITPDRHSGRRFVSMLPSEGQLILPVRGEKILQTSEELDIQRDLDDKTAQLQKLLDQIKGDKSIMQSATPIQATPAYTPSPVTVPPVPTPTPPIQPQAQKDDTPVISTPSPSPDNKSGSVGEAEEVVRKVKEENERLANDIERLKKELEKSQISQEEARKKHEALENLEKEKKIKTESYSALQKRLNDLKQTIGRKSPAKTEEPKHEIKGVQPKYSEGTPTPTQPNIVSGILKGKDGNGIAGTVLLIKNHKGESVRALKTNAFGQFSISTPLVNGMYTLEVGTNVEGYTFDIITVEIRGEIIPPIEITGKND